ncbi:IFI27 isoform 4, partial [Pongo abelii]
QDCYSCDWRSYGRGGCAHGAQCHGLHCGGNRLVLHSSQDDVRGGHCQWGWSCLGQPCGYSAVTGVSLREMEEGGKDPKPGTVDSGRLSPKQICWVTWGISSPLGCSLLP